MADGPIEPAEPEGSGSPESQTPPRWRAWVGGLSAILLLALVSAHKIGGYDIWWHLANGAKYLGGFSDIFRETFSYTHLGGKVVVNAYAGDILLRLLYVFGEPGVVVGWSLIYATTVYVLYRTCRDSGVAPSISLALCLLAYLVLRLKHTYRPEAIAFLGFATAVWILVRARQRSEPRLIWLVPPLFLCWGWFNSSAVFALPMVFLLLLEEGWVTGSWRRAVLVFLLTVAASVMNPAGLHTVLSHQGELMRVAGRHVGEYSRLDSGLLLGPLLPFAIYLGGMVLVAVGAFRTRFWWRPLTLALAWITLGVIWTGVRVVPFFVLVTLPWIAAGAARWSPPKRVDRWSFVVVPALGLLAMLGAGLGVTEPFGFTRRTEMYPERVRRFLDRYGLDGPLLTALHHGGYFVHFRKGRTKVAVDGRSTTAYPVKHMLLHYRISGSPRALERFLERYPTDLIMAEYSNTSRQWYHVLRHPGWQMVHWDRRFALLVRRGSRIAGRVPARERYRRLDLTSPLSQLKRAGPKVRGELRSDLCKALRDDPGNPMARYLARVSRARCGGSVRSGALAR